MSAGDEPFLLYCRSLFFLLYFFFWPLSTNKWLLYWRFWLSCLGTLVSCSWRFELHEHQQVTSVLTLLALLSRTGEPKSSIQKSLVGAHAVQNVMTKKPKYLDRRAKIVNTEVTCWCSWCWWQEDKENRVSIANNTYLLLVCGLVGVLWVLNTTFKKNEDIKG
jgi:hypothetical protein